METYPHLTIRAIRARTLDLAPHRPMETASGILSSTPLVLIDLLTGEGVSGTSYVRCYAPVAVQPLAQLIANLEPLIKGDTAAPLAVERTLQRHFRLLGPQGLTGIAMAGIDMALWDARAKACGVPLITLLGGAPTSIPAYASLRTMSPEGAAMEAEEMLARGFTAIKVKVGRGDLAADLTTIRAKGALERADHRPVAVGGEVFVAAFATRSHLQHGRPLSQRGSSDASASQRTTRSTSPYRNHLVAGPRPPWGHGAFHDPRYPYDDRITRAKSRSQGRPSRWHADRRSASQGLAMVGAGQTTAGEGMSS